MGDGDSRYVSKPPVKADLNVLCVDGTRPTDSAAFFNYLESAGKRIKNREDRVVIQNLLSLIGSEMGGEGSEDLFDQAVQIVARERKVSISYIQRRLQIGYNRAAGLIERMEDDGMISKPNHQGKREILLPEH